MKTPIGIECKYFFGDYYRGRNREECRLIGSSWTPSLCANCGVPAITRANSCEYMRLQVNVRRSLATVFKRRVRVIASCKKTERTGFDPHIGCGNCHPLPPIFQITKT